MEKQKVGRLNLSTSQTTTTTEHHPALAHQFDSMEQQQEASTFGMWVFLLTELMMFGGLFTAYLIYRLKYILRLSRAAPASASPGDSPTRSY